MPCHVRCVKSEPITHATHNMPRRQVCEERADDTCHARMSRRVRYVKSELMGGLDIMEELAQEEGGLKAQLGVSSE